MKRIFWASDSTVKNNDFSSYPQTGIAQGLSLYLSPEVQICNYSDNGKSTKSFIDEGRLDAIEKEIGEGDFLFIQFGHNDAKADMPDRYAAPFGAYQANLRNMIDVAKSHGANPVLITPLSRRSFNAEGVFENAGHGDYPIAMKMVSMEAQIPCIDLCGFSYELVKRVGDAGSKRWYMNFPAGQYANFPEGSADNTHLRFDGAVVFAEYIAFELKQLGGLYKELLSDKF